MRFKNLTIHVTLGFLSVIALVALALLPITNGICEWTGDESSKSYYTNSVHIDKQANPDNPPAWSEDTRKGRGWHLSANLSASVWGSSAYMSCSIYGEKPLVAYTGETTYSGTANVRAWRIATGASIWCDTCQGYYDYSIEAAEDKNTDEWEVQTIAAKVKSIRYYHLKGVEYDESAEHTISTGLKASTDVKVAVVEASVETWAEYTWTHESGKTLKADKKIEYNVLEEGDSQSQSAGISNWPALANSNAETNFYFEGTSSSNSVSYWHNPGSGSGSSYGYYGYH